MNAQAKIKQQVREFYDQIGWQMASEGFYQNARYEDLRPVARAYIHRCHLRVARHLKPQGEYLLDAGSGPIQYPEYLEYSRGYRRRVCADISLVALQEARARIGDHGLFVVADVAHLPFKGEAFDGVVSLHTIHHLPQDEHLRAYEELYRVLKPASSAVVVNGWADSTFKRGIKRAIYWTSRLGAAIKRLRRQAPEPDRESQPPPTVPQPPRGTFVDKVDANWLKSQVGARVQLEVRVWRSVNVRFLRHFIHPHLGGRGILRLLFWLEEQFPHFFGEHGVYPLIVIRKPQNGATGQDEISPLGVREPRKDRSAA